MFRASESLHIRRRDRTGSKTSLQMLKFMFRSSNQPGSFSIDSSSKNESDQIRLLRKFGRLMHRVVLAAQTFLQERDQVGLLLVAQF